jgi:ADP-ribosylation factor-binding protein GGA
LLQDPDAKPDYRAQTLKEINKVEAKVILLNEMLDNVDTSRGEQFVAGDVYEVNLVHSLLQSQFLTDNWVS